MKAECFCPPLGNIYDSMTSSAGVENAHPSGPLIDWDPDIVEALDEDFDLDDPDNILDDDFVLKANQVRYSFNFVFG